LPARVGPRKFESTRLSGAERRIVYALIVVMIITIFQSTAFYQVFNVNPIWIQQHVALDVGGFRIPVPWFQSINSISSVLCVPLVFWIWRRQALRRREPDDLAKIGIGAWIGGFYEKMTPAKFWTMHAAIAAGGGLLVLLFDRRLSRTLYRSPQ